MARIWADDARSWTSRVIAFRLKRISGRQCVTKMEYKENKLCYYSDYFNFHILKWVNLNISLEGILFTLYNFERDKIPNALSIWNILYQWYVSLLTYINLIDAKALYTVFIGKDSTCVWWNYWFPWTTD